MSRFKNIAWNTTGELRSDGRIYNATEADKQIQVLMDIRDELRDLNKLLGCHNAIAIPSLLRDIKKNTTKRKPAKKGTKPPARAGKGGRK